MAQHVQQEQHRHGQYWLQDLGLYATARHFRVYDAIAGIPGQIAYGIDDLVPNEHERDDTVSLRLDDSRGSNYRQQFTFGFHRLTDRYNDNEMPTESSRLRRWSRMFPALPRCLSGGDRKSLCTAFR